MPFRKLIMIAALSAAGSAHAAIRYDFTALTATITANSFTGSFSYISPDFISSDRTVSLSDLASCTISNGEPCGATQKFISDTSTLFDPPKNDPNDAIVFYSQDFGEDFYFQNNAFQNIGFYTSQVLSGQTATLQVSRVADVAPAPEPSSWALMLGGFALVGGTLRRNARSLLRSA